MIIFGADPGASGAIAFIRSEAGAVEGVGTIGNDCSERDTCDWIESVLDDYNMQIFHAYIERVSASPGAGVSGMFRFGQSYGRLSMLFTAHKVSFDLIGPHTWQQAMGCARPKGEAKESQTTHKNRTKARAQQLFPNLKITHAIADALLIAEYGRRLRAGEL